MDDTLSTSDFTSADESRAMTKRSVLRMPFDRINWKTSSFLIGTLLLTLTAVPLYLYRFGLDWFQVGLFFAMFLACGFSISIGYHRLFSHITFRAGWPIRLLTLLFGAAAFENSVLMWASEHRRHHKHVDHEDDDPYSISKGFFYAHIGWLIFKLNPDHPYDNVADLQKDKLVSWQDRHVQLIAVLVSFGPPSLLGFLWNGWVGALGAFLIAGVARIVVLQHCTFLINSACHAIGRQPYSTRCTARDSFVLALFTFGEGYHNYHHEFQYDYRNGVKPWQFDPTKWIIWTFSKIGLVRNLRRAPAAAIRSAEQETGDRVAGSTCGTQPDGTTKTVTTTTESVGTITEFTPGESLILKTDATEPMRYKFGKTVTYVNAHGKVIEASKFAKDSKVRIHWVKDGDNMLVDKVTLTPDRE